MGWTRAFSYLRPSELSAPNEKRESNERWWHCTSRSIHWRTDVPLLQHASKPCEQIAAPLCVSSNAFESLFAFWYPWEKTDGSPFWLLQIHKLLFFLNIGKVFNEVREPGWRNQVPKTRDRCLNPWFTSDELLLGHVAFEVIHYICIFCRGRTFLNDLYDLAKPR